MNVGDRVVLKAKGRMWLPKDTMRGGARVYVPAAIISTASSPSRMIGRSAPRWTPITRS